MRLGNWEKARIHFPGPGNSWKCDGIARHASGMARSHATSPRLGESPRPRTNGAALRRDLPLTIRRFPRIGLTAVPGHARLPYIRPYSGQGGIVLEKDQLRKLLPLARWTIERWSDDEAWDTGGPAPDSEEDCAIDGFYWKVLVSY